MDILCIKDVYITDSVTGKSYDKFFSKDKVYSLKIFNNSMAYYVANDFNILHLLYKGKKEEMILDSWIKEHFTEYNL